MNISIIGTVGVPANYGGFETLVEQLVQHNDSTKLKYTVYSRKSDAILILGVSGCAFLPIFRIFSKKKLIINIDGLEHRRDKWNKWVRKFLKFSERQAVKYGDIIVTDNKGITDYVEQEYGKSSELIAYGGDHVLTTIDESFNKKILDDYGLTSGGYSLAICRIEPENNVHIILEAFEKAQKSLVFIGNWQKSEYGENLARKYKDSKYVKITPAVYDLNILNVIRSNCSIYIHGHSAGGTNPSLVEAMFFEKPIIAFDCIYNRESTENKAVYFSSTDELITELKNQNLDLTATSKAMREIAERRYKWETIAQQYENLYT